MIYFSTISFVNLTVSSNSNQIIANVVFCKFLKIMFIQPVDIITTVLGFSRVTCYTCQKKHIMLEICIFFIFDFSERSFCCLLDSDNRNRHFSWNILPINIILGSLLLPL